MASQVKGEERAEAGTSSFRATRFRTPPSAVRDCWRLLLLLLLVLLRAGDPRRGCVGPRVLPVCVFGIVG